MINVDYKIGKKSNKNKENEIVLIWSKLVMTQ